jgi:hypothetical protein
MVKEKLSEKVTLSSWQMFLILNKKLFKGMISKAHHMVGKRKALIQMPQKKITILNKTASPYK